MFAIDVRSLALFRVALGALLLVDLAIRAMDLGAMYTDDGMFSRAEICRRATTIWNWSFHFGGGSTGYQAALFLLAGVLALALLIGWETRLTTIGSWLMLVSLHHRVPVVLSGAEILLRMLLFWAMFLPLGRAWSLDRWREQRRAGTSAPIEAGQVVSIASAAILLQMALMYLFSAIAKSNTQWFRGEALAGILAHDFYALPPAAWLLGFPLLMKVLTWGALLLEWAAPLLLLLFKGSLRLAVLAALLAMHLGIGLCLEVGLFSFVSMAGLALFLPAEFWNSRWLAHFLRSAGPVQQGVGAGNLAAPHPRFYYAGQGLCLVVLIYIIAVNINTLPGRPLAPLAPETWRPLTRGLGLSQGWTMFGSVPSKDGWYVAHARLEDGSEIDLLRAGAAVDWRRPDFPARQYPNHFWHKIFREMAYYDEQGFQVFRAPVAEYLCRRWNAHHASEKQIAEFEFVFCMADKTGAGKLAAARVFREPLVHLDFSAQNGRPLVSVTGGPGQPALGGGVR